MDVESTASQNFNIVLTFAGTWRCDLLICPNSTYACTILKVNDPKRPHLLNRTNICYDRNWNITGSHSQPENMPAPQPSSVYVALHSRVNATLDWSISYGLKSQFVNASLEPQNFSVLKQDTRNLINAMDNSWSQINRTFRRKNRDWANIICTYM